MFGRKPKVVNIKLDEIIDRIVKEMDTCGPYSPEYPKLIGHLQRAIALRKSEDKESVSANTKAIVIGNLVGILIIVCYEHMHVVTSKSLAFILKPKD